MFRRDRLVVFPDPGSSAREHLARSLVRSLLGDDRVEVDIFALGKAGPLALAPMHAPVELHGRAVVSRRLPPPTLPPPRTDRRRLLQRGTYSRERDEDLRIAR